MRQLPLRSRNETDRRVHGTAGQRPDKSSYTAAELALLGEEHKQKIKLSDAILVVNVGGYIGSATCGEIVYAEALGKEILYYTDLIE